MKAVGDTTVGDARQDCCNRVSTRSARSTLEVLGVETYTMSEGRYRMECSSQHQSSATPVAAEVPLPFLLAFLQIVRECSE